MKPFIPSAIKELQQELHETITEMTTATTPEQLEHFRLEYTRLTDEIKYKVDLFAAFRAMDME